jgi:hypothetical protein
MAQRDRLLNGQSSSSSHPETPQRQSTPQPSEPGTVRKGKMKMVECHGALNTQGPATSPHPETPSGRNTPRPISPSTIRKGKLVDRSGGQNTQASGGSSRSERPSERDTPEPKSLSTIRQPSHIEANARSGDLGPSKRNEDANATATCPLSRRRQESVRRLHGALHIMLMLMFER